MAGPSHSTSKSDISEVYLKLMTEATCSEWLIGGAGHCASGQPSYGERQLMLP